jgi:hypothetical protein
MTDDCPDSGEGTLYLLACHIVTHALPIVGRWGLGRDEGKCYIFVTYDAAPKEYYSSRLRLVRSAFVVIRDELRCDASQRSSIRCIANRKSIVSSH